MYWRERIRELTGAKRRPSGKATILEYFKLFVGEDVASEELMVVSGIAEYARRIRELRVQSGYDIVAGDADAEVRQRCYRLYSVKPDGERAAAWKSANTIRKRSGSNKSRILLLLKKNIGVPLNHTMLQYVGKGKDTRERLRDLRLNDGWRIATHRTGRPDLRNDEYMLLSGTQLPTHDRLIPAATYEAVLQRDGGRCRKCNWPPSAGAYKGGKRHNLEVHHKFSFASGGDHSRNNLLTLCNLDHDLIHKERIEGTSAVAAWLKEPPPYYVDD